MVDFWLSKQELEQEKKQRDQKERENMIYYMNEVINKITEGQNFQHGRGGYQQRQGGNNPQGQRYNNYGNQQRGYQGNNRGNRGGRYEGQRQNQGQNQGHRGNQNFQ